MDLWRKIAENRIAQSIADGEFENLPAAGKKIDLSEYFAMPAEKRAAYQLLKNAHIMPSEVNLLKEIADLRIRQAAAPDPAEKKKIQMKLRFKETELRIILERRNK
jgi:hypothetical protein